jgi:hypothetical protein
MDSRGNANICIMVMGCEVKNRQAALNHGAHLRKTHGVTTQGLVLVLRRH